VPANTKPWSRHGRTTSGSVAGGGGTADELEKLAKLRDAGTITSEEFAAQKAKLLA
jgi:hypothetical protein